jgi:hypothetical protein
MIDFIGKLKRNRIWSIAVYVENGDFSFLKKVRSPKFVLDSKKLRTRNGHVHTYADPFLYTHNDELYIFFESQAVSESGKIAAFRTRDLVNFEDLGEILKEPFHLSFPFVFAVGPSIYLMPETFSCNEVSLYKFTEFPNKLEKTRTLLRGAYRDSSFINHNGIWYFFTTSNEGLELFYTEDLENGHLIPHPHNPLTDNPRYSQCGGSPIVFKGEMFRVAQDCSTEYGKNISILRINELSRTKYEEEVLVDDYFDHDQSWNSRGGHHLSIADFMGKTIIAVDGKQDDLLINKILSLIHRA